MSKDLTEALHALTEAANGQTTRVDKKLPAVKVATEIPVREGSSPPISSVGTATSFTRNGEKTIVSSDGLFTFYYPETLKTIVDNIEMTVGVITKNP